MTTAIDDDATDGEDADGEGDYEINHEVDDDDVVNSNTCNNVYVCVVNEFWHYFACAVFVHIILC